LGGAASITATVAVPVATPADDPDSTRPSNRSSTPVAPRNAIALPIANTVARNNIGRRPIVSDQRPNTSSAASTPPAYVANTTVAVRTEKGIRSEYSAHIGVGSVVPSMITANVYARSGKARSVRQLSGTFDRMQQRRDKAGF
jgi:hypothetical protein